MVPILLTVMVRSLQITEPPEEMIFSVTGALLTAIICVNARLAASDDEWKVCLAAAPVTADAFCCKFSKIDSGKFALYPGATVPLKETL